MKSSRSLSSRLGSILDKALTISLVVKCILKGNFETFKDNNYQISLKRIICFKTKKYFKTHSISSQNLFLRILH